MFDDVSPSLLRARYIALAALVLGAPAPGVRAQCDSDWRDNGRHETTFPAAIFRVVVGGGTRL